MKNSLSKLSNHEILISPSILSADFAKLGEDVKNVERANANLLHIDVMDGHFVPNISFGFPIIKSLRKVSNLIFDTHLMISKPLDYVERFVEAGSDHITFHLESESNVIDTINKIHDLNITAGISIKPKTTFEEVLPYIHLVDMILVMSVEPGFGGQSFMPETLITAKKIRQHIEDNNLATHVEIDGGINFETAKLAVEAGVNILVSGNTLFASDLGLEQAITKMKSDVEVI